MSLRVAITGAAGRLGARLCKAYADKFRVIPLTRAELDLSRRGEIVRRLADSPFDVLVNCAAVTDVDRCELHPAEATAVNADAVSALADACEAHGARLIQISTDYVFPGNAGSPLREEARVRPLSVYGHLKARAEAVTLSVSRANVVARVSWLFGPEREGFVDQMIRRALSHPRVAAIDDKWASPTYTVDLAAWLEPFVSGAVAEGGLFHFANAGGTTWRGLAQHAIDRALAEGLPLKTREVEPMRLADMAQFVAPRPVDTILSVDKLAAALGHPPRPWQEAVSAYVADCVHAGKWTVL